MSQRANGLGTLLLVVTSFTGIAAAEHIGPYNIVGAPTSAELISGGGASFTWLNVVNAPVSVQVAFTSLSVIADGYADANSGTTIRLTYAGGVRNGPGADLVLFEAGPAGSDIYVVSTDYDNFAHAIVVSPAVDTGVDRTYFQGGAGPLTVDVLAAAFDLSALDIPVGASITQLRVFAEGPSCDLLGIGVSLAAAVGDTNCDGGVNFFDIDPFLLAMFDPPQYFVAFPGCDLRTADIDSDGNVDFFDIDSFLACIFATCP